MSDFDVKLPDGKIVKQSFIKNSTGFQKELLNFKVPGSKYPLCLCQEDVENNLIIKKRGETIFLAGWPGSGCLHNTQCQHYHEAPDLLTGKSLLTKGAKVEKAGRVYFSCDVVLNHRIKKEEEQEKIPKESSGEEKEPDESKEGAAKLRKIGLIQLFYDFWMGAQLHQFTSGSEEKRTWGLIRSKIVAYTRNIYVNKVGMAEGLFIPFPFSSADAEKIEGKKEEFFQPWRGEKLKDLLVLGELKDVEPSEFGMTLKLRHESLPLYMSERQFDSMCSKYSFAMNVFEENQRAEKEVGKIMVIAACNMPSKYLTVKSITLIATSSEFIPASSFSELKMIYEMVRQKRSFYRPAKFDNDSTDTADFVIVDTDSETLIAIYDSTVENYDEYKRQKEFNMKMLKYPIWSWYPGSQITIPELPQKYDPLGES